MYQSPLLTGGTLVYMDGENFDPNLTLRVNGNIVPVNTFYSSSRIRFTVPSASTPGTVPVMITSPSGQTASTTYTYNTPSAAAAPTITKLSATSGPISGGSLLYIDGANFEANLKVSFGGVLVSPQTFYNSTRFRIWVPAASVPGIVDVKVINPDGKESNALQYQYN